MKPPAELPAGAAANAFVLPWASAPKLKSFDVAKLNGLLSGSLLAGVDLARSAKEKPELELPKIDAGVELLLMEKLTGDSTVAAGASGVCFAGPLVLNGVTVVADGNVNENDTAGLASLAGFGSAAGDPPNILVEGEALLPTVPNPLNNGFDSAGLSDAADAKENGLTVAVTGEKNFLLD